MKTRITEILEIEHPILQGGMAWVAEHNLAAAVSEAGGLGIIGAGGAPAEAVREQIQKVKAVTNNPFGVNIMLMNPEADEIAQVMQENLARRTYTMSLMAMVFLPSTFLTGLFGVNLGGIPGGGWQFGFSIFCILLVVLIGGVALWLHRSKWL